MNADNLKDLHIDPAQRRRPRTSVWLIFLGVLAATGAALFFGWPRPDDDRRMLGGGSPEGVSAKSGSAPLRQIASTNPAPAGRDNVVLTVSGYIVNRERIELSPRFMGVVKWLGVSKGDSVTNGQVVALLDDAEYKARLAEVEGRLEGAKTAISKAELEYNRVRELAKTAIESKQAEDNARLAVDAARATAKEIEGQRELIKTYIEWTVIRSPINGVVLEKLADANELVTPQSFGGTRGPSTALIALADPNDLQVEVDLNESDLAKIYLKQPCRVSPEAYPDHSYEGYVAERAPEANRQKGTLQIKVQIRNPDKFLTPELTARVDFLGPPPDTTK
ncbi:MAG: efflux RND transporter periplasmic adaptor subunit [Verrucomicrobiota bacterium]